MVSTLRLANWNINRPVAPSRVAAVRTAINAVDADIIVLTEAHDGLTLDYEYKLSSLSGRDGLHSAQHRWVSIYSRFPMQLLQTSDRHRTVAARVGLGDDSIVLFGIVLPWRGSAWRDSEPRDAFQASLCLQMEDVSKMRGAFPEDDLFIIGDFNQDLCGGRYAGTARNERLLRALLQDAKQVAITADENDPVRRATPAYACIDHICMPRDARWAARDVRCWPASPAPLAGLSDHFGVVADLVRRTA